MRAAALLPILLAGCATTGGDIQEVRDSWNGAVYKEVVSRWGPPNRHTIRSDGAHVYTWESERTARTGAAYPSVAILGGSGGVGIGTGTVPGQGGVELVRCDRTLVFRSGRVADQTWQGQPAYCDSFKR
jgi:hypothetical protein